MDSCLCRESGVPAPTARCDDSLYLLYLLYSYKKVNILTLRAASQVHNLWQAWGLFEAAQLNFDDARKYLVSCH